VSSTDSESEVRPREVGREDPPHCAERRAERTQRLQALLPAHKRTDPVARRSLRALYSQLLWEAYWLRCPWIWVGAEARELLGSFYQVGALPACHRPMECTARPPRSPRLTPSSWPGT
jgi:hypothetical protein